MVTSTGCCLRDFERVWGDAEVRFSHPAEIRRGDMDDFIHEKTAVVDLPFHPNCGLHIDHHLTNKPTEFQLIEAEARGCKIIWDSALSAARVCFDTFREIVDLSDIEQWMEMVDKLDGGRFLEENSSQITQSLGLAELWMPQNPNCVRCY